MSEGKLIIDIKIRNQANWVQILSYLGEFLITIVTSGYIEIRKEICWHKMKNTNNPKQKRELVDVTSEWLRITYQADARL